MTERFPVRLFPGTTAWFSLIVNLVRLPFALGLGTPRAGQPPMILAMIPVVVLTSITGVMLLVQMYVPGTL